jgi:hypothetical protein
MLTDAKLLGTANTGVLCYEVSCMPCMVDGAQLHDLAWKYLVFHIVTTIPPLPCVSTLSLLLSRCIGNRALLPQPVAKANKHKQPNRCTCTHRETQYSQESPTDAPQSPSQHPLHLQTHSLCRIFLYQPQCRRRRIFLHPRVLFEPWANVRPDLTKQTSPREFCPQLSDGVRIESKCCDNSVCLSARRCLPGIFVPITIRTAGAGSSYIYSSTLSPKPALFYTLRCSSATPHSLTWCSNAQSIKLPCHSHLKLQPTVVNVSQHRNARKQRA